MKITIATRGSELALAQSQDIGSQLESFGCLVSYNVIKTQGDLILDKPLQEIGGKGLFTKEIDNAVLENKADISVHSLKDMPSEDESGLILAAVPKRKSDRDVIVVPEGAGLPEKGATIACGSLRRRIQLSRIFPDSTFVDVRGNIGTRLQKMKDNKWDGLVMAEAAINRLELTDSLSFYPFDILPAAGQGALGIRARTEDTETIQILQKINDPEAKIQAEAERAFIAGLGGGCHVPAGIRTMIFEEMLFLEGAIFSEDGEMEIRIGLKGEAKNAAIYGKRLAKRLLEDGGEDLLKS